MSDVRRIVIKGHNNRDLICRRLLSSGVRIKRSTLSPKQNEAWKAGAETAKGR